MNLTDSLRRTADIRHLRQQLAGPAGAVDTVFEAEVADGDLSWPRRLGADPDAVEPGVGLLGQSDAEGDDPTSLRGIFCEVEIVAVGLAVAAERKLLALQADCV